MTSKPAKPKGKSSVCQSLPVKTMKLSAKEARFCELYSLNGKKVKSYSEAFPGNTANEKTIWRRAERLLSYPKIQKRLEELKERMMEKHDVTVESLIRELEEARKAALSAETAQASAAVSATMGKAKLVGLDKQRVEISSADGTSLIPTRIELVTPDANGRKG